MSVKEFPAERLTERPPPDGAEQEVNEHVWMEMFVWVSESAPPSEDDVHEVNEQSTRVEVMLWMDSAPPEDKEVQSVNERPSKVTENEEEDEDDA